MNLQMCSHYGLQLSHALPASVNVHSSIIVELVTVTRFVFPSNGVNNADTEWYDEHTGETFVSNGAEIFHSGIVSAFSTSLVTFFIELTVADLGCDLTAQDDQVWIDPSNIPSAFRQRSDQVYDEMHQYFRLIQLRLNATLGANDRSVASIPSDCGVHVRRLPLIAIDETVRIMIMIMIIIIMIIISLCTPNCCIFFILVARFF
jgi:hypothetical protein